MKHLLLLGALWVSPAFAYPPYTESLLDPARQEASKRLAQLQAAAKTGPVDELIRALGASRPLRNMALHRLISVRCDRYLSGREARGCRETSWEMLQLLDHDLRFLETTPHGPPRMGIPPFVFVAFKGELVGLLRQQLTGQFLREVVQHLQKGHTRGFNLFETAQAHFGGEERAVGALAVLFQDTSPAQAHLEFLAREGQEGGPHFHDNLGLLGHALELLAQWRRESPERYRLLAYPKGQGQLFNGNIYHHYVPWHLAAKLRQRGRGKRQAAVAPFMLVATYEFITATQDLSHLTEDPARVEDEWKQQDLLAGFLGARRGAGHESSRSLNDAGSWFIHETRAGMRAMLEEL